MIDGNPRNPNCNYNFNRYFQHRFYAELYPKRSGAEVNKKIRVGRVGHLMLAAGLVVVAGCTEARVFSPEREPVPTVEPKLQAFSCVASRVAGTVTCASEAGPTGGVQPIIIGGQNSNVRLTSSAVTYSETDSIFSFDVTLTNLMPEALGTPDGVTLDSDGIEVFFHQNPVAISGSGSISVENPDGFGTFTAGSQPYFRYDEIVQQNATTGAKRWQLKVPPSVGNFQFLVLVETDIQPLLVINEVLVNPGGTILDANGEWFELYNAGSKPVDLEGFVIADSAASGRRPYHRIASSVVVPAGGYVVLGNSRDTISNGGVRVDYAYGAALQLANSLDAIKISRVTGTDTLTIDRVQFSSAGTSAQNGVSRELRHPGLENQNMDGPNWANGSVSYGPGGLGTPGAQNTAYNADAGTEPGPPVTVVVSPATVVITLGGTRQFSAVARDSLSQVTTTTITWSTLDNMVATVSGTGMVTGVAVGQAGIVAVSANGLADTAWVDVQTPVGLEYLNHLEFGTPFDATPNDEVLLTKPQFALSYSPSRGGPNWVAWNLNETHFGEAKRCDCFLPDGQLPDTLYRVVTSDYLNSGYSRGHMVMSQQRTASNAENEVTFLMTNILPQIQDMNGGPWLRFENHNNALARDSAKELYIIAGGTYSATPATLNNAGRVQIPETTWKIVVVLDRGKGLADVQSTADIRVIAVNMPNSPGISGQPWTAYETTVAAIEAATGYDFLAELPDDIEAVVEAGGPMFARGRTLPLKATGTVLPRQN